MTDPTSHGHSVYPADVASTDAGLLARVKIGRPRGTGHYAVFFYDPDGIKLDIVHEPSERDSVKRVQELARRIAELEGGAAN